MKRIISITTCLAIVILAMTSCFSDDLSDCPPEDKAVRVYFEIDAQTGAGDAEEIDRMSLFVFDAQERLVTVLKDDDVTLSGNYYMTLSPGVGEYTFVAWANLTGSYACTPYKEGTTQLEELEAYLVADADNAVRQTPGLLYFARTDKVQVTATEDQYVTMLLNKNNNTVHVRTEGLPAGDHQYNLAISARNGSYKFDNSFASDTEEIHYITECTRDGASQLSGSLTIMRLARDRRFPVLKLEDTTTGETLYSGNLIDLILRLEELSEPIDIEKSNVYNILLRFDADLNVSVSVNGWNIVTDEAEI